MKFVFVSIITATIMSLMFIVTILVRDIMANEESILIRGLLAFLGVFVIALLAGGEVGILSKSNENDKNDEIGGDKK